MSKRAYLTLTGLKADECHVDNGFYASGLISVSAFGGFVHHLNREMLVQSELQFTEEELEEFEEEGMGTPYPVLFSGFLPILVSQNHNRFSLKKTRGLKEDSSKASEASSAQHLPESSFEVELVIQCDFPDSATLERFKEFVSGGSLVHMLASMRLSGGLLLASKPRISFGVDLFESLSPLSKLGFMLEDASSKVVEMSRANPELDAVDLFVELNSRPKKSDEQSEDSVYEPRYVSSCVGYCYLEQPSVKKEQRDSRYAHRFSEPIVGLVRLRTVQSLRFQLRNQKPVFLFWQERPSVSHFIYQATPINNQSTNS